MNDFLVSRISVFGCEVRRKRLFLRLGGATALGARFEESSCFCQLRDNARDLSFRIVWDVLVLGYFFQYDAIISLFSHEGTELGFHVAKKKCQYLLVRF